MKLYSYGNSSAAFRVRIALNIKGIKPDVTTINLIKDGGEQHAAAYKKVNPQELVPALEVGGQIFGQSLAIVEYLDETYPTPRLLPTYPAERARVRQIAFAVACDIHPINNLSARQYLKSTIGASDDQISTWYRHWIDRGFRAIETLLATSPLTGRYCHGNDVTLADLCLVPQVYNARRYKIPLDAYPTIVRVDEALRALPAFADAVPEKQPDAS